MVEKNGKEGEMKPKRSMRKAVNLKCKDCNYDPLDRGTWRQQVGSCTATDCSLHEFRPKPSKAEKTV